MNNNNKVEETRKQAARYQKAYKNYFRQASHGLKARILKSKEDPNYQDPSVDKFVRSIINAAEK